MDETPDISRRALVGAILGGTAAAGTFAPVAGYLRRFAPLTGSVWEGARPDPGGRVESPYGPATVRVDEHGVPHVEADTEQAAYFAIGHCQAADRLFQIDLQRRVMSGRLSEVVGEATVDSDEFHLRMDFRGAAEATWDRIKQGPAGAAVEAFADGVNAYIDQGRLPIEFSLLEYEPSRWSPVDTMLMEKQIAWNLTGDFRPVRRARAAEAMGETAASVLFPRRYDHDSPIIRPDETTPEGFPTRGSETQMGNTGKQPAATGASGASWEGLAGWLSEFESPPGTGSNSWLVSGEHTASGEPLVANDPHLSLSIPPVWYEQATYTPDMTVRGVTFPGVPFVVIGATDRGAWGFTNAGCDVVDLYTYERDGESYRYRDQTRTVDSETQALPVADGRDREVSVEKTVHGPLLDRDGREVAVAWPGLGATRTTEAIYEFERADGVDDHRAATRKFDTPTQCMVYADVDGRTLFHVTGRVPIRRTDGSPVAANRLFDGSNREGEWSGFQPFETPEWSGEGFIPFEEMPNRIDPDVVGTANQRLVDDDQYPHYLAASYAPGFRGERLWDLLDGATADGGVDRETMRRLQRDTRDRRVDLFRPILAAALDEADLASEAAAAWARIQEWDGRMDRDSQPALVFDRWLGLYRTAVFGPPLAAAGLDESFQPDDRTLASLDPDGPFLANRSREALAKTAFLDAIAAIQEDEHTVYGDVNRTGSMSHPFEVGLLDYPDLATDGAAGTLFNYRRRRPAGSSIRAIWRPGGTAECSFPGGNVGVPFSDHYDDGLQRWADGRYRPMDREPSGEVRFRFTAGADSDDGGEME